ncbi:MAG: FtsQ-type POTRA domain-containing protein [Kouleothrix sp.]|nr:FtsQ-type POTRA domain-containing protein [Kouleothrix sp.]
MSELEAPPTPSSAPPLRGRSTDHRGDDGSSVRPRWRRRAWRWLASGRGAAAVALLGVIGLLAWAAHSPRFLVHRVTISGNRLVDTSTLTTIAAVEGQPIWAVDPAQVAARLQAHPYISDSTVTLRLPDQVQIDVHEPRQAISWQSGAQRFAIAPDGRLSPLDASIPISATSIIQDWRSTPAGANDRVPPAVVALAQALIVRLPAETGLTLQMLGWDLVHGLVAQTSDGRVLLWGDGSSFNRQLQVAAALNQQHIEYRVLDLRGRIAAYRLEGDPSLPLPSTSTPPAREP